MCARTIGCRYCARYMYNKEAVLGERIKAVCLMTHLQPLIWSERLLRYCNISALNDSVYMYLHVYNYMYVLIDARLQIFSLLLSQGCVANGISAYR